jgi:hypothetical protein
MCVLILYDTMRSPVDAMMSPSRMQVPVRVNHGCTSEPHFSRPICHNHTRQYLILACARKQHKKLQQLEHQIYIGVTRQSVIQHSWLKVDEQHQTRSQNERRQSAYCWRYCKWHYKK